jgi:hypothetical protein
LTAPETLATLPRAMTTREWRLSGLFAAFLLLKVAEAGSGIELWPLSNVSMFSQPRPAEIVPLRSRLVGTRGSGWFDLSGSDFRLSRDEFINRLRPTPGLARRCRELVAAFNHQTKLPWMRIRDAMVTIEPIPRPGIATDVPGRSVACTPPSEPAGARDE